MNSPLYKASRLLPVIVAALALLEGCAGARVDGPGGDPVPVAVVRFDNVRPGGGPREQNIREFADALTSTLVRFGYQPSLLDFGSPIPPSGLALSGGVTELPDDSFPRGAVRFYCTIFRDGREVKRGLYAQTVYPDDRSGGNLEAQNRAINLALLDLMSDLEEILKVPAKDEGPGRTP